jgi:hypothetical protein
MQLPVHPVHAKLHADHVQEEVYTVHGQTQVLYSGVSKGQALGSEERSDTCVCVSYVYSCVYVCLHVCANMYMFVCVSMYTRACVRAQVRACKKGQSPPLMS